MPTVKVRWSRLALPVVLLVVSGIGSTRLARADQPVTANGTFVFTSFRLTSTHAADGNTFYTGVDTAVYLGDLAGPVTDIFTLVVHADGSFNAHGIETCTTGCTLGGRTGGLTAVFATTGSPGGGEESRFTFTGGSGGLVGLHGEGTATASTYAYAYHFER